MNTERIGLAAGAIWSILRSKLVDGCTVNELKKRVSGFTGDEVAAGIGWLAREGKLCIDNQVRKTIVCLAPTELATNAANLVLSR